MNKVTGNTVPVIMGSDIQLNRIQSSILVKLSLENLLI